MAVTPTSYQIRELIKQQFWIGHIKLNDDIIIALQAQGIDSQTDMRNICNDGQKTIAKPYPYQKKYSTHLL